MRKKKIFIVLVIALSLIVPIRYLAVNSDNNNLELMSTGDVEVDSGFQVKLLVKSDEISTAEESSVDQDSEEKPLSKLKEENMTEEVAENLVELKFSENIEFNNDDFIQRYGKESIKKFDEKNNIIVFEDLSEETILEFKAINSGVGEISIVDTTLSVDIKEPYFEKKNLREDNNIESNQIKKKQYNVESNNLKGAIDIPDVNLVKLINTTLGKGEVETSITKEEMESLTTLNSKSLNTKTKGIVNLEGLEYAINLRYLDLENNKVEDINPISNLTLLETLNLYGNKIVDISPLYSLLSMKTLDVGENQIENIESISELTNIETFWASNNKIKDISSLINLKKINSLDLHLNNIEDVEPIRGLTSIETLWLEDNHILDVSSINKVINSPNIRFFGAKRQTVDLGIKKINGTKVNLPNPTKTAKGTSPLTTISNIGVYNKKNDEIEWSGLNLGEQPISFEFKDNENNFSGKVNLEVIKVNREKRQ